MRFAARPIAVQTHTRHELDAIGRSPHDVAVNPALEVRMWRVRNAVVLVGGKPVFSEVGPRADSDPSVDSLFDLGARAASGAVDCGVRARAGGGLKSGQSVVVPQRGRQAQIAVAQGMGLTQIRTA